MEMVMELLHRRVLAVEGAARQSSRLWRRLEEALVLEGCKGTGGRSKLMMAGQYMLSAPCMGVPRKSAFWWTGRTGPMVAC